jgi:APA family basic amino acid/polyamine antiporter
MSDLVRSDSSAAPRTELPRQLGLGTATSALIGEVVAVGIFLTPAGMAKSLGSPLWILIVWLISGGIALCGALCFGELAARFPDAGGAYIYLREAYGPRWAFLHGWVSFLVMDPGITAACAVGLASYAASAAGGAGPHTQKAIALSAILVLAAANILGARLGAGIIRALTVAKFGILILLALWGFGMRLGHWSNFTPFAAQRPGSEPLLTGLAAAFVLGFFSFGGWWSVSKIAGEVRDPQRTLPRAFALGICSVTLLYILTSTVFLFLVPLDQVGSREAFAAQAGQVLFGTAGRLIFSLIVVLSIFGALASMVTTSPRLYFAMARDGLFFSAAASVHPRFGTPALAIVLQATVASCLVLLGTFDQVVAYFFFVAVVFLALTVASIYVFRRRGNTPALPPIPGYPVTPAIFLAFVAVLLVLLAARNPFQSFLGVAVVAVGFPFYSLVFPARRAAQREES